MENFTRDQLLTIALKAYEAVESSIKKVGLYSPISLGFEHRHYVAHAVIRKMGGWILIAGAGVKVFRNKREKFISLYIEMYNHEQVESPLFGASTIHNEKFISDYKIRELRYKKNKEIIKLKKGA